MCDERDARKQRSSCVGITITFDPQVVRDFEYAGWERAAAQYAATFARATQGFIDELLHAACVGAGMRVLDLACGPGPVTAALDGRGAHPVGLDFSPAMLTLARGAHPSLQFEEGDAEASPFADRSFDAVVGNFGIHHVRTQSRRCAKRTECYVRKDVWRSRRGRRRPRTLRGGFSTTQS
jgi:SAM-dependent methyltransferase